MPPNTANIGIRGILVLVVPGNGIGHIPGSGLRRYPMSTS